jgi:hypothetical protein
LSTASNNYLPRPDGDFDAWIAHFFPEVNKWWKAQGLNIDDLSALNQALEAWHVLYPAHVAAQAAAEGARSAKDQARQSLEAAIRPVTRFVQSYPTTTNADRALLGISVRTTTRSRAAAPNSRPLAIVDAASRLTHQLRLVDESTPTRRAKPQGVLGAEVWVKLVDADTPPPTDPAALSFLALTTQSTCRAEFPQAARGKTAVYMVRWVNTRGEKGPWSEITTATVAA